MTDYILGRSIRSQDPEDEKVLEDAKKILPRLAERHRMKVNRINKRNRGQTIVKRDLEEDNYNIEYIFDKFELVKIKCYDVRARTSKEWELFD